MAVGVRRPVLLLVNPAAGGKPGSPGGGADATGDTGADALAAALEARGMEVTSHLLAEDEDPGAVAAAAGRSGHDVVVAGGDGTVGPVAAALLGTDATLGILPLGSFNNVARGAGVPTDLDAALDVVAGGHAVRLDAGLAWHPVSVGTGDGSELTAPDDATVFFEAAGVGIDAAGFGAAQVAGRRGAWAALRSAWRAMRRRAAPISLTLDGSRYRTTSPAVTVCNGPYHGFGFALASAADPSDGELDVVVFRRMSRLAVIRHFLRVARGRPVREPRVEVRRARSVTIAGVAGVLPAHADGRSIGVTPVAITVRHGALRLFSDPRGAGSTLAGTTDG